MPIRSIYLRDVSTPPVANAATDTTVTIKGGKRGLRVYMLECLLKSGAALLVDAGYGDIKFNVGGKTQRTHNVTEIDEIGAHINGPTLCGIVGNAPGAECSVPIRFAEFDREQYGAKKSFAFDIPPNYGDNEVQLVVSSKDGATAPTANFRALVQHLDEIPESQWNVLRDSGNRIVLDGEGRPIPTLLKILRKPRTVSGTEENYNDIPLRDVLQGLYLYDPADATSISKVTVTINGEVWFERTRGENDDIHLPRFGLQKVPGVMLVCPDITDDPRDSWILQNKNSCDIKVEFKAAVAAPANQMKVLLARYGTPE